MFLLGLPELLEVWFTDSRSSVDRQAEGWLDKHAPPGVRRREFFTGWTMPCRDECNHRDRGPKDICHGAAYYRNVHIVKCRPDLCLSWVFNQGERDAGWTAMAKQAGIPTLVTEVQPASNPVKEPEIYIPPTWVLAELKPGGHLVGDRRKAAASELRKLYERNSTVTVTQLAALIDRSYATVATLLHEAGTEMRNGR
jgi:hypothetical protein